MNTRASDGKASDEGGTASRLRSLLSATVVGDVYRSLRYAAKLGRARGEERDIVRAQYWVDRGDRLLARGETERALAYCRTALSIHPDSSAAYQLMARALMPGDNHYTFLACLHQQLRPKTYVEIGVATGASLTLAGPETKAIGIDPAPEIAFPLTPRTRLFSMTSDEFFRMHSLDRELGGQPVAMAFLDGLHDFRQVLKDFIAIERYSDAKTIVLLHDCLPVARAIASRERATSFWCGDVWKIIPCLRSHRADLHVQVAPVPSTGLGVVTGLNPKSTVLQDRFDQIVAEYENQGLDYEYLEAAPPVSRMRDGLTNECERICRELGLG